MSSGRQGSAPMYLTIVINAIIASAKKSVAKHANVVNLSQQSTRRMLKELIFKSTRS